jgi:hypothetical protein
MKDHVHKKIDKEEGYDKIQEKAWSDKKLTLEWSEIFGGQHLRTMTCLILDEGWIRLATLVTSAFADYRTEV